MGDLITGYPFTVFAFVAFIGVFCYALWLRYRLAVSKARFALAAVSALVWCLAAFLLFLSGPGPLYLFNGALNLLGFEALRISADGPGWLPMLLASLVTLAALGLIGIFSVRAVQTWEGPVTVSVSELAKQNQDNSLTLLAFAEARRLARSLPDPLASDAAINWQQKQSQAPPSPSWHSLARSLFETAFREASFDDSGWRDRFQAWVGTMYVSELSARTIPLVLFVFDEEPDDRTLVTHVDSFLAEALSTEDTRLFVVFGHGTSTQERAIRAKNCEIEVWPRKQLLRTGLRLTEYARELIKRFETEQLGGTKATLKDTFVEAHVRTPPCKERKALSDVLNEWLSDTARRHLAITGEYGQGKSTAMLEFCVRWAKRYLSGEADGERVPLLVELRGKNPAEIDPLQFLSGWAVRYALPPQQILNLIRAGDAILIFEGFDELRNAGRAFDRHEHFNALWRMAYLGTKVIFTGRPNFFLDETERNRTLRAADSLQGAVGNAYTQLWELDRLTEDEIRTVAQGFGDAFCRSLVSAVRNHPSFREIVSRPSMLPVVATIWDTIEELQSTGHDLTGAMLLELYLQAIYQRKEEEIESDRLLTDAPESASYILLPREIREVFTLAVVWRMAGLDARNTISRAAFNAVVNDVFGDVFKAFQTEAVPPNIVAAVRRFEERYKEETRADRVERVSSEIATTGLFVPDPAGGVSNLRLPHKQFYEYLIAKAAWTVISHKTSYTSRILDVSDKRGDPYAKLVAEDLPAVFFSEITGEDLGMFKTIPVKILTGTGAASLYIAERMSVIIENIIHMQKSNRNERDVSEIRRMQSPEGVGIVGGSISIGVAMAAFYTVSTRVVEPLGELYIVLAGVVGVQVAFMSMVVLQRRNHYKLRCLTKVIKHRRYAVEEVDLPSLYLECFRIVTGSANSGAEAVKVGARTSRRTASADELKARLAPIV